MVVGVVGLDQVCEDYLGVQVVLASQVEDGFYCKVSVLAAAFWGGSILLFCAMSG